jgi:AmmeMemoRadiSam system protein B
LDPTLGPEQACGHLPIAALLIEARRRGIKALRLDLRNSGDTAGPGDRVVGYGSWAFC